MKKNLKQIYVVLNNTFLRKTVFLLPLLINLILTILRVSIYYGRIDMEYTNSMETLFIGSVVWFFAWVLIIIHTKTKVAKHILRQQNISHERNE